MDPPPPYYSAESDPFAYRVHRIQESLSQAEAGVLQGVDTVVLDSLTDAVLSTLASIPDVRPPPRIFEAVLVPADALGPGWTLTNHGDPYKGEVSRVVRVTQQEQKGESKDSKTKSREDRVDAGFAPSREFDGWGRWEDNGSYALDNDSSKPLLWWSDGGLAQRLACDHLRPNLSRDDVGSADPPVAFTVDSDELTFRRENEMGLWESKTGWCIVVTVKFRR